MPPPTPTPTTKKAKPLVKQGGVGVWEISRLSNLSFTPNNDAPSYKDWLQKVQQFIGQKRKRKKREYYCEALYSHSALEGINPICLLDTGW